MSTYLKRALFATVVGFIGSVAIWLPLGIAFTFPTLVLVFVSCVTTLLLNQVAFRASAHIWRQR